MTAQSKAWFCARSLARIGGSNPTGSMDVCLLWVLYVVRFMCLRRADHSTRGVLPSVVCLCVMEKLRQWEGPGPVGAVPQWKRKLDNNSIIVWSSIYHFKNLCFFITTMQTILLALLGTLSIMRSLRRWTNPKWIAWNTRISFFCDTKKDSL